MSKDYYKVLGVERSATAEELKKAYRTLSRKFHPDLQQGKSESDKKAAEERFKEINEAYSVLGDEKKRDKYDRFGTADMDGAGFGPGGFDPMGFFRSHFADFGFGFGDFGFGPHGGHGAGVHCDPPSKDGGVVQTGLEISFEEALFGTTREFDIRFRERCVRCKGTGSADGKETTCPTCHGQGMVQDAIMANFVQMHTCPRCHGKGSVPTEPCPECHGSGVADATRHININIPAGVATGTKLRVPGGGEHGVDGGRDGDLYLFLKVQDSELFQRRGNDLTTVAYMPALAVGIRDEIEVDTPYGSVKAKLPKRMSEDGTFKVKVDGAGVRRNGSAGDLYVTVVPEPIANLTPEQRAMAERLLTTLLPKNSSHAAIEHRNRVGKFRKTAAKLGK